MQAPGGKQLKIHGNVVNVPADVSNTVRILSWLQRGTGTIKVNLKRRLQYKSSALSLNIKPNKVIEAATWLISNSDLYKEEGVANSGLPHTMKNYSHRSKMIPVNNHSNIKNVDSSQLKGM